MQTLTGQSHTTHPCYVILPLTQHFTHTRILSLTQHSLYTPSHSTLPLHSLSLPLTQQFTHTPRLIPLTLHSLTHIRDIITIPSLTS